MRYLLALLCGCALQATAQTSVPQLITLGTDTLTPMNIEISSKGYTVGYTYYEYCTNITCFNDGMRVTVYDSNGHLATTIKFEKPDYNTSTSSRVFIQEAAVDNNNDLILTGTFHSDVDFDPNNTGTPKLITGNTEFSNTADVFIGKYRISDGRLIWVKVLKGTNNPLSSFSHLTVDKNNNIYLLLSKINGNYDLNPGSATASVNSQAIAKYNSSGDYLAHKNIDPISTQYYKCLRYTGKGLFLLTSQDSAGKKTFSMKQFDMNTLTVIRSKKFGWFDEDNTSTGRRKTFDFVFGKNEIWMLGDHISTLNLPAVNGTLTESLPYNERGFFIARLDTNWNVLDARSIQKTKQQYYCPVKIGIDADNNLLIIGSVMDSLDADLGSGTHWVKPGGIAYKANGYMLYYNNSLALQWTKTFGDTSNTNVGIVQFGVNRNIYVAGNFKGKSDFSVTGTPAIYTSQMSNANGYYARYRWNTAATNSIRNIIPATSFITLYPNPATDMLTVAIDEQANNSAPLQWRLFDAQGRILQQQILPDNSKKITIPVGTLPSALYYLQLSDGQTISESHSFIKQ